MTPKTIERAPFSPSAQRTLFSSAPANWLTRSTMESIDVLLSVDGLDCPAARAPAESATPLTRCGKAAPSPAGLRGQAASPRRRRAVAGFPQRVRVLADAPRP